MGIDPTEVDKKLLADVNVELAKSRKPMLTVTRDDSELVSTSGNIIDIDQQSNSNESRIMQDFDNLGVWGAMERRTDLA